MFFPCDAPIGLSVPELVGEGEGLGCAAGDDEDYGGWGRRCRLGFRRSVRKLIWRCRLGL